MLTVTLRHYSHFLTSQRYFSLNVIICIYKKETGSCWTWNKERLFFNHVTRIHPISSELYDPELMPPPVVILSVVCLILFHCVLSVFGSVKKAANLCINRCSFSVCWKELEYVCELHSDTKTKQKKRASMIILSVIKANRLTVKQPV